MYRGLPSLPALRSFEAAARHESFKAAAEELSVTPTAIGSQVQLLEQQLDCVLFIRQHRQVRLTHAGRQLQAACSEAFGLLAEATTGLRQHPERATVTLGVGPLFASEWLTPRLNQFWELHPTIGLRLHHTPVVVDFARYDIDAMVAWGDGRWPGVEARLLLPVQVTPVASPRLLDKLGRPRAPGALVDYPLLHEADETAWRAWFSDRGVTAELGGQGVIIQDGNVVQQAAIDGQGVALGIVPFVEKAIADGRLVRVFRSDHQTEKAYYLVYPKGALTHAPLRALHDWLIEEARQDSTSQES